MKYILTLAYKEPTEENMNRADKIDKERENSGEGLVANKEVLARYVSLSPTIKVIQIVEINDTSRLIRWVNAYAHVCNVTVTPVVTPAEWYKAVEG